MKTKTERNNRRLPGRFTPEDRFARPAEPAVTFRATEPEQFEQLKESLLREQLPADASPELTTALRRAANDAAAEAWMATFPLLVFPELFREKAIEARRYAAKQAALRPEGTPGTPPPRPNPRTTRAPGKSTPSRAHSMNAGEVAA